jgi:hypothetical protein
MQLKDALVSKIDRLKQVLGIEKRVKNAAIETISVNELDALPLNSNSYQLQNLLYDFCGANK